MGSDTHLASVTSLEQQRAVAHQAAGTRVWIGLNDIAEEGNWVWSDGEPVDFDAYTNWIAGDPNGGEGANGVNIFGASSQWADDAETKPYP